MNWTETVTGMPNTPFSVLYQRFWMMASHLSSFVARMLR